MIRSDRIGSLLGNMVGRLADRVAIVEDRLEIVVTRQSRT